MKRHLPFALVFALVAFTFVVASAVPARADVPKASELYTVDRIPFTFASSISSTGQTSAPGQVIYISLSKQHMWVYQDGQQVFSFVISSGIPTRATKPGNFRVQDKIPNAWSNVWQLSMPNWLGIYNVGRVENGIHALPITKRGVRIWGGILGHPASFGCIILNTPDAVKLYDWAQVGALVIIRN
jgi:lipoprotein-anchoring transpeptidase ErfK/SrfK